MTLTSNESTLCPNPEIISFSALHPVVIVRMSAIGDTILTARTHAHLFQRGYAPFLLSHQNNCSLLECMPLLRGACLVSETETTFWLRENVDEKINQVEKNEFEKALTRNNHEPQQKKTTSIEILDLQNTRRSARAIKHFAQLFENTQFQFKSHKVAKLTIWRLLLVLWGFLALRQFKPRRIPNWLKNKLAPVHVLQRQLVESLPQLSHHREHCSQWPVLKSPLHIDSQNSHGHILFFVGASFRLKSWPREHFRTLLNLILTHTNANVVLCGGKDDLPVGEYLSFPQNERIINAIGQTTLSQSLRLIGSAAYVVTGDSFASHAADLLGRPASVIFGATHPLLGFGPSGSHTSIHHSGISCSPCSRHGQGHCRYKNLKCLTLVTPEEVFTKIKQKLDHGCQSSDSQRQTSDS